MTLELKVRKIGNSLGIVLPKKALAHLKVEEGDTLTVSEAAERSLRLSPQTASRQMKEVRDVIKRYRNTLRELAK
jgi:putative addiction module antidote